MMMMKAVSGRWWGRGWRRWRWWRPFLAAGDDGDDDGDDDDDDDDDEDLFLAAGDDGDDVACGGDMEPKKKGATQLKLQTLVQRVRRTNLAETTKMENWD